MSTYSKPTPNAMCQIILTFISAYNPKDPSKLLFKHCTNCQKVAIVTKVPYTSKQLLMNEVNFFMHLGIYACNCKAKANKNYVNLCPFIQATYQHRLASGLITATQSGYASNNRFAGLTTKDDVLDDGTANTIVELFATHMANLLASVLLQASASNNANMAIFNALMEQVTANKVQHTQEYNHMVQQFMMMLTAPPAAQQFAGQQVGWSQAVTQSNFIP
jgi:hypothetical protein